MNTLIHVVAWILISAVILICLIIRHRRQTRPSDRRGAVMDYYDRLAVREIRRGLEEAENEKMVQEELDWEAKMFAEDAKRAYEKTVREDKEKAEAAILLDFQNPS